MLTDETESGISLRLQVDTIACVPQIYRDPCARLGTDLALDLTAVSRAMLLCS